MAKDDFHVIAYRILAYLYLCMKEGEKPDCAYLNYGTDDFPIGQSYWYNIWDFLNEDGYVKNVSVVPILGKGNTIKLHEDVCITPRGIAYMQENSTMGRAKEFLKTLKEIIPGI